jgi:tRNA(Ile)-lysidine synthase
MENSKSRFTSAIAPAIAKSLDRHVISGQAVVVGLSGGIDSMALLHAVRDASIQRPISLAALHVHHALSPNADQWEAHCREICVDWNIPLTIERVAVERGTKDGLEAAARRARHAAFESIPADWIALAHHADDQAETMLFNLLRGTGVAGAAAMAGRSGKLLRPLLDVRREEIDAYARHYGLRWIEDESNGDTRYSRNHLRHEVLSGLEGRFPGSRANLAAAASRFREALGLLDELAVSDLGGADADFPLAMGQLEHLSEPRARNALRFLLQKRHIGIPSEERLRELLRQLIEAAPDRHPEAVFGEWRIFRKGKRVFVEPLQDIA